MGSLPTLISPSVATVHGKVQFFGGKFRSENLQHQRSLSPDAVTPQNTLNAVEHRGTRLVQ